MKNSKSMDPSACRPRTIVFLAAPSTQILDVAGPFQVFVRAAELFVQEYPSRKRPYNVVLASSTHRKTVTTNCGLVLTGTETFRTLRGPMDTLLVAGGTGLENAARDEELLAWLRTTAQRVRRIGSICTGAFLLAAAGLLDGKRATTHWKWAAELAKRSKLTTVDPDPIYIRDGNTYTTAGITAGIVLTSLRRLFAVAFTVSETVNLGRVLSVIEMFRQFATVEAINCRCGINRESLFLRYVQFGH